MSAASKINTRLLYGTAWSGSSMLVLTFSGLIINILLSRILSPDDLGGYFLIVSIINVGMIFSLIGIHQAIVKFIGRQDGGNTSLIRDVIRSAFIAVCCFSLFTSVFYVLYGGEWAADILSSEYLLLSVFATAAWVVLRAFQMFVAQTFRGLHDMRNASIFEGGLSALLIAVVMFCIFLADIQIDLEAIFTITIAVLTLVVSIGFYLLQKRYRQLDKSTENPPQFLSMMGMAFPLFLSGIGIQGIIEAHIWVLSREVNEASVALYGIAFRVARFVAVPLIIINNVLPPIVAKLSNEQKWDDVANVLRNSAAVAGIPSLILVLFLLIFGEAVLGTIFGKHYRDAALILSILATGQLINVLTGSPGVLLAMSGYHNVVMLSSILIGVFGLVLSCLLVSSYEAVGVAIGFSVGLAFQNIFMWAYCRKKIGIYTHIKFSNMTWIASEFRKITGR